LTANQNPLGFKKLAHLLRSALIINRIEMYYVLVWMLI